MTRGLDHERNDRIEAIVMMAALSTLGLLVALAVSTSVTSLSGSDLQAAAPIPASVNVSETASDTTGIDGSQFLPEESALR